MAIVAVGGYGRGTLAPGSDVDLLFLLPYKQTPWGESVVEFILYVLWDLGLKVGHATRSVAECIRLVSLRHDHPHRHSRGALHLGRAAALRRAGDAFRRRGGQGHRARVHRRQARRARHPPPPAGRLALPRRAQRQGRQGRPPRSPHAVLDRQVFLPGRARATSWSRPASSRAPSSTASTSQTISCGRCAATSTS